jgi:hypothetical protein
MGEKWPIKFSLTITTSTEIVRDFFTCRTPATWDRRLYFSSEERSAEDFFARKIRRLRPGLNPRPAKPLFPGVKQPVHGVSQPPSYNAEVKN